VFTSPGYQLGYTNPVEITVGSDTWTFGNTGNFTLPNGGAIILENGDGVIGKDGDDLVISWDDEELILRSVSGDVQLEADGDVEIRSGYNFGTGDYGSRWIFNNNGELQGIPQDTANSSDYNGGYIQFVGNSSGDGAGYTTLQLIPDETRVGTDQYLIVDPTAPGHIHIRAGGTQDNSFADLFLGGENSYVKVGSGSNPPITVTANTESWTFGADGNLTLPGNTFAVNYANGTAVSLGGNYGNANVATFLAAYGSNTISTTGNITAGNLIGNISITGNVQGTSANVTLVAGAYDWTFDNTGNLTLPGNTFSVNYANNTPVDVVTRFEGTWSVPTGNSTQSFTVDANNTYQMWVEGNIPNGIITWNATATITNTNVPVAGAQYAWVYNGGGTPIDFTSIPNQFEGTSNTIVRSNVAPSTTTNRFDFGINNASGNVQVVRYGWIKIS
jgi:hypothetical protein